MLSSKECFKGGRVDRDALKLFIKDIKKNTKLSDEDAAVIAASKVNYNINSANTLYPGNIYILSSFCIHKTHQIFHTLKV